MAFVEGRVEMSGADVRYLESGTGEPLVHLHGGEGLHLTAAHEILARRFRVIALEVPSLAPAPDEPPRGSKAALATSIADALTRLGIERVDVWGASGNARTALWLALQAPAVVRSVVLEAPAPIHADGAAAASVAPAASTRQRRDADLEQRLPEITTPALALFGTRDELAPPHMGRTYRDVLPNAHLVFVYDAGHEISADRPDAFAEVVSDFLERREAFVISRDATVIHP